MKFEKIKTMFNSKYATEINKGKTSKSKVLEIKEINL